MTQKPQKEPKGEHSAFFSAVGIPKPEEVKDDDLLYKIRRIIQQELAGLSVLGKAGAAGAAGTVGKDGEDGADGAPGRDASVDITIWEVVSAATGDGIYNCNGGSLDYSEWGDTAGDSKFTGFAGPSEEVLNLLENDPVSSYAPALGKYDRMVVWRMTDDQGTARRVGIPLTPSVRRVKTTEAAPAATNITCNLILNNDAEAASGELGYNIEVYNPLGDNFDDLIPQLAGNGEMLAQNIQGKWWLAGFPSNFSICA